MKTLQKGFTLIELVVVIIVLGILAAAAVPQFINLAPEADAAALSATAGALNSANALNYGACKAAPGTSKGTNVADCTDIGGLVQGGALSGYTITSVAVGVDAAVTCTVTQTSTLNTATFTAIGTSGC